MNARDPILVYFANYIEAELGIVYADHNDFQLQKRLDEIAKELGLNDLTSLYSQSKNGVTGSFKQLLLDTATNNETSFFRDPLLFQALLSHAIPELAAKLAPAQPLRIWSAACSTGQEPLSIAMTVEDWKHREGKDLPLKILATDISERALKKCRAGLYSDIEVQRGLNQDKLHTHFRPSDQRGQWQTRPDLMACIQYRNLNLKEAFQFSETFDLILCRNVLIYQSVEGKTAILKQISSAIRPGGLLILGFGESLLGLSTDYERVAVNDVVLYRRKMT